MEIINPGDKAACKLIHFVEATTQLPLPSPENKEEQKKQVTFNILNNTIAGTGAVRIEIVKPTSIPPSDLNANIGPSNTHGNSQPNLVCTPTSNTTSDLSEPVFFVAVVQHSV